MKLQLLLLILSLNYIGFISGMCHYFSTRKKTFSDALQHCEKQSLCLADMDTETAFNDLRTNLNETLREDYWFGLHARGLRSFQYISNDKPVKFIPKGSNLNTEAPCAYLRPSSGNIYVIHTANCNEKKYFVCAQSPMCKGVPTSLGKDCVIPKEDLNALGIPNGFKSEL